MAGINSVLVTLIVLNLTFANKIPPVSPVKKIAIAKCCAMDERLTSDYKCLNSYNSSWELTVYLNGTTTRFIGNLPPRWEIKSSIKPRCSGEPAIEPLKARTAMPLANGHLFSITYEKYLNPNQYCLDYEFVMYCRPIYKSQNMSSVQIKKCCGKGGIYADLNSTCIRFKDSYNIDVGQDKTLIAGFPDCEKGDDLAVAGKLQEGQVLENGTLIINTTNAIMPSFLPSTNYCLEHIFEQAGGSASIFTCKSYLPVPVQAEQSLRLTIYPIGLAISAIFLAATLAAGSLLPTTHHVLHWKCQTNHVACLLLGDVLLCISQIAGARFAYPYCFTLAVAMHFLFLSAFFWLNTMCFNIWWTFRDLRPQNTEKYQERIRLYFYEAYAWGGPFIFAFVGAVSDLSGTCSMIRPGFAEKQCWFAGDTEIMTYFFIPMGILLSINLILFALTAQELTCGLWKRELVKSTTERAALGRVCAKLVVVMGVTWIMDVISWFAGGPEYAWYFTDLINCLQGVFIFIVVGCQPQVLSAVKRSWCFLRNRDIGGMGTTNQDHHSSSSHGLPSVGGDTLTNTSTVTNTTKSTPLETNC
ncbi:probable G-protein coupled receptor Mth-like 1 [Anthonomus grandis grandis]|uniref:probable G-protein coupled receptor Mth-like 1 n=1 Tax=Anthonomus grandis grandis TaxID=2921223 RepID=UPI00216627FA|nr:probable G-protein coupled receptor Mth-like 1 [Anthonomus grandis grandis]